MERRVLERWSAVLGGCTLAGAYFLYIAVSVLPRDGTTELDGLVRTVVDGHAQAPYQYRFLVPSAIVWLSDHASITVGQATMIVDGAAMAVAGVVGFALLKRSGLGLLALPAGLYCAYVGTAIAWLPKPETVTAFACVTIALIALERRPVSAGWWSSSVVWLSLIAAGAVLVGCRTELLFALAAGFAVRYRYFRLRADGVAMVGLAATAVLGSVVLIRHYSDARYPKGTAVVQLFHNLDALPLVVAACFLLPALAPLIVMWRHREVAVSVGPVARAKLPLLSVIVTEILATFTVGRIEEIRLLFPISFALAWVGLDLWRALVTTLHLEDAPIA